MRNNAKRRLTTNAQIEELSSSASLQGAALQEAVQLSDWLTKRLAKANQDHSESLHRVTVGAAARQLEQLNLLIAAAQAMPAAPAPAAAEPPPAAVEASAIAPGALSAAQNMEPEATGQDAQQAPARKAPRKHRETPKHSRDNADDVSGTQKKRKEKKH